MADTVKEPVHTAAVHPEIQVQAVEPAVVLAEKPEQLYRLQKLLKERLSQLLCLQVGFHNYCRKLHHPKPEFRN
jgi:hypothetical protein